LKRILSVLAVAALMAAIMVASAMPALAAASDNSSCKGQVFSDILEPGDKGELVSESAKEFGGLGQSFGEPLRSCNPNANPNGGARP
jgi:hypothetical protein